MSRRILVSLVALSFVSLSVLPEEADAQRRRRPLSRSEQRRLQEEAKKKAEAARKRRMKLPTGAAGNDVDIEIAPVDRSRQTQVKRSAAKIDELIEAGLKKNGLQRNAPVSDEVFVRRAYLDITGTIPTAKQAASYIDDKHSEKASRLIDKLLNSPGYASHRYNYWADVLRLVDRPNGNIYLRPYNDWVKDCLRKNESFDKMVHEMLTAEGKPWENPATGYVLRDQGMPLDNLNNTIRIFLGTRIGCAQCHDHPFDRWTQKEFYEVAAFAGGVETRMNRAYGKGGIMRTLQNRLNSVAKQDSRENRQARGMLRMNQYSVWENVKKNLKYPHDYSYDNAKPNEVVKPAVIFGRTPSLSEGESRRQAFASWLASEENPRFALTIANRMWKHVFGIGLIEPVDDMMDETVASNPELMDFLSTEMTRLNFNLKEFQRVLYNTRTYQSVCTYDEPNPEELYQFPGPVLRRMTAEQVWDSLLTLSLPNPDSILRPDDAEYTEIVNMTMDTTGPEMLDKLKQMNEFRREDGKMRSQQMYRKDGQSTTLARASELPQPLPDGHFLRQFGQSNRQIISDSTIDGTVPQLLTMFNGPATHMMLEEGSVIYDEVVKEKKTEGRMDVIFLSLLSRRPSDEDLEIARYQVRGNNAAGYGNVIWALLNTREFLFVQ